MIVDIVGVLAEDGQEKNKLFFFPLLFAFFEFASEKLFFVFLFVHNAKMDQLIQPEDPTQIFTLDEELAEGSFGVVYRFVF